MTERFRDQLQEALAPALTIEREITGGGMSRVFVALEHALGRTVVVKVLRPDLAAGVNRDRFRREIMLVAQLQHPHIVPVLSAGERGELIWYTMPFVEGESLREALARRGRFSAKDVVRVLHDVLDALAYAHQRSVIHRDIKPGNILTHGAHALVTDFGVAKALSAAMPQSGATSGGIAIGTPAYMAPEQLAADPHADHRMDLYAVGLLAYELLTGEQAFSEESPAATMAAQLTRMPEPLAKVRPDVPAPLVSVITRMLAKQPDERPPTAAAALEELEELMTPQGGVLAPATGGTTPRAFVSRALTDATPAAEPVRRSARRWAWPLAGVAVFIIAAGAALLLARDRIGATSAPSPPGSLLAGRESAAPAPPPSLLPPTRTPNDSGGAGRATAPNRVAAKPESPATPRDSSATKAPSGALGTTPASTPLSRTTPPGPGRGTGVVGSATRGGAAKGAGSGAAVPRQPAAPLTTPAGRPRRVAVLPVRDATSRPQLAPVARIIEDSLKRAAAGAGYTLASDAELVRILADNDLNTQRRTAESMGIGAVVTGVLMVNNRELQAQVLVVDVWRNTPQSLRSGSELDDSTGTLTVVRDALRALNRVSWRNRDDPHRVVVFDFDNQTGVASLVPLVSALADSVRAAIRRMNAEIIGDSAARATRDANERRFLGVQLGAGAIVGGSVSRRGADSLRVRVTVRDMSEERAFDVADFTTPSGDPFAALPNVVQRIVTDLGHVNWGPKGTQPPSGAEASPTRR